MAPGSAMRVSDAEREAAAAELREHFASGRLTQDEFDERLSAALAARTRGDLSALFTDLPSAQTGGGGAGGPGGGAYGGARPFGPSGSRGGWYESPGRTMGTTVAAFGVLFLLLPLLMLLGLLTVFGIGVGRPFGIVLLIAVLAVLRRLLLAIFGRRRTRGRGPRRRC